MVKKRTKKLFGPSWEKRKQRKKKKNATWRWQWAHLVICTCNKHYLRCETNKPMDGSNSMVLSSCMVLPLSSWKSPRVALVQLKFKQKIPCQLHKIFLECSSHFLPMHLKILHVVGQFQIPSYNIFWDMNYFLVRF